MTGIDKKQFLEKKVKVWEKDRYLNSEGNGGLAAACKKVSGASSQFRLQNAVEFLKPHVKGKRALEVGWASSLLYEALRIPALPAIPG